MKYAVEMGLVAMIYIPSFIKVQASKINKGIHRQHGDLISLLLFFFFKKGSRLMKRTLKKYRIKV
jgi:hypothetical protein